MPKEKNKPATAIEQTYKSIKTILEKARSKSFNGKGFAINGAILFMCVCVNLWGRY